VSDHAVLRYMEREMGIDVQAVRKVIETKVGKALVPNFIIGGFVVKKNVVITYYKNGAKK